MSFTLVFIGLNFLQAEQQGKGKPSDKGKPEDVNWGVRIPDSSINMYGMGSDYTYWDNDGDIRVDVEKLRSYGKEKTSYYVFQLRLYYNPDIWFSFQNVVFDDPPDFLDLDNPSCVFPEPPEPCAGYGAPYCMACFLNGQHPRSGYQQLRISFSFHNLEIEEMTAGGDEYHALHDSNTISISVWYSSDCFQQYHNVGNWVQPAVGLFIKRETDDIWKISVRQPLTFRESYCVEEPIGKGNKTKQVRYTPLIATGDFDFEMDWIKQIIQ